MYMGVFRILANIYNGAFSKIVNGCKTVSIFAKVSIINVRHSIILEHGGKSCKLKSIYDFLWELEKSILNENLEINLNKEKFAQVASLVEASIFTLPRKTSS